MYLLRTPPAKEPFSFPGFRKEGFLHHQPFWVVLAVSACWMVTALPSSLHGGLVYWGTKAFVANADSRARMWTADFTLVLGVFSKDFVPLPSNRGQWLAGPQCGCNTTGILNGGCGTRRRDHRSDQSFKW